MTNSLVKKTNSESIHLDLPKGRFSLLSHPANIDYCIDQIKGMLDRRKDIVVGYYLARSIGTVEMNHVLVSRERAEELKKRDKNFRYFTLEGLLREKRAYEEGRYKVNEERYFVGIR